MVLPNNSSNIRVRISISELRSRYLPKLNEELSKAIGDRLESILPLFDADENHEANFGECLKKLYPTKTAKEAGDRFRNDRNKINKAAKEVGIPLSIEVDTGKRSHPSNRRCWFEGPSQIEAIEEFAEQLVQGPVELPSTHSAGIQTSGQGLGKTGNATWCVIHSQPDRQIAKDLVGRLRTLAATRNIEIWAPDRVITGENSVEEKNTAIAKADIVVYLVSPQLCASGELNQSDFEPSLSCGICLKTIPENRCGLGRLEDTAIFCLETPRGKRLSFQTCQGDDRRGLFAQQSFEQIIQRIERAKQIRFAEQKGPPHEELARELLFNTFGHNDQELEKYAWSDGHPVSLETGSNASADIQELEGSDPAIDLLDRWACDLEEPNFIAILGEYGVGKTTVIRQLATRLFERRNEEREVAEPNSPLPIFIDLTTPNRTLGPDATPTLDEYLNEHLRQVWKADLPVGFNAESIRALVRSQRAVIFFDGLDEKLVTLPDKLGTQFVQMLWSILPPSPTSHDQSGVGKVVISCRSHLFPTLRRQNQTFLGNDRTDTQKEDYRAIVILPFKKKQIRQYIAAKLDEKDVEGAVDLIDSVHDLAQLSTRPYLLSLITEEIEALKSKRDVGESVNAASLYQMMVDRWLVRDDGKHRIQIEDKPRLMELLAAKMWREGVRQMPWDDVHEWFTTTLDDDEYFRKRYKAKRAAHGNHDLLEKNLRTATFVLRPDNSAEDFRFAHFSIQEYFVAAYLVRALTSGQIERWSMPMPTRETIRFVGELLSLLRPQKLKKAMAALEAILNSYRSQASELTFQYWLTAIQSGFPEPAPDHVDLQGVDLGESYIRGRSDARLNLRGANLSDTWLVQSQFQHVDLDGADLSGARADAATFFETRIADAKTENASFAGSVWRFTELGSIFEAPDCGWEAASATQCSTDQTSEFVRCLDQRSQALVVPRERVELTLVTGHSAPILACAWSPNGKTLLSASSDNTLKLWDPKNGKCTQTLTGHKNTVWACAWSPDGKTLLSASSDNTLKLWDPKNGKCTQTLTGHKNTVWACAWSPDGKTLLSASSDNTLKLWDPKNGKCTQTLTGHKNPVTACAWSPDGKTLLSASYDNTLKLWEPKNGKCTQTLTGHKNWGRACAWSPDGKTLLSASYDNTLKLWDPKNGKCTQTLTGHKNPVTACAWSPDGKTLLSASYDNTLKLWDPKNGKCTQTLTGHKNWGRACAWSPDGKTLLSASDDNTLKLWDPKNGKCTQTLTGHKNPVLACAWSPDGKTLLSASYDNTLKLWDPKNGKCTQTLTGHKNWGRACAWSPDGKTLLSASYDNTLKLWDPKNGKCTQTLTGHKNPVLACAWSPDGKTLLSASYDNTLKLWEPKNGKCTQTLTGHKNPVLACAWSPDGKTLLSASYDNTLKLWDPKNGKCTQTLTGHKNPVTACAWSPDGKTLLSASSDNTLKLWDPKNGKCTQTLTGHKNPVTACAWSPDGKTLLSASSDNTLKLWDPKNGKCTQTLTGHKNTVWACAWSPDGKTLLSASSDNTLKLWDPKNGAELMTLLNGHSDQVAAIDLEKNRVLWAAPEAWRILGWRYRDQETGLPNVLPAEYFGSLPHDE